MILRNHIRIENPEEFYFGSVNGIFMESHRQNYSGVLNSHNIPHDSAKIPSTWDHSGIILENETLGGPVARPLLPFKDGYM